MTNPLSTSWQQQVAALQTEAVLDVMTDEVCLRVCVCVVQRTACVHVYVRVLCGTQLVCVCAYVCHHSSSLPNCPCHPATLPRMNE